MSYPHNILLDLGAVYYNVFGICEAHVLCALLVQNFVYFLWILACNFVEKISSDAKENKWPIENLIECFV